MGAIYPPHSHSVKTISVPILQKEKAFAGWQEVAYKDVEHAFGVFQSHWHLPTWPIELHNSTEIQEMVMTTIVLHMMVQE